MTESNDGTVEVKHDGETIEVLTAFEHSDLAAWFGDVPESFEIDRIYVGDEGLLEAETYLGDENWVSMMRQTEDHRPIFNAHNDVGWVADIVSAPGPEDAIEQPGETVWERGDE